MHFDVYPFFPVLLDGKNNGGSKRYSRKREPTFAKTESLPGPRRSQPQKSKNFDKRPPQRGGGGGRQYGLAGGGRREEVCFNKPLDCDSFVLSLRAVFILVFIIVWFAIIILVNELLENNSK